MDHRHLPLPPFLQALFPPSRPPWPGGLPPIINMAPLRPLDLAHTLCDVLCAEGPGDPPPSDLSALLMQQMLFWCREPSSNVSPQNKLFPRQFSLFKVPPREKRCFLFPPKFSHTLDGFVSVLLSFDSPFSFFFFFLCFDLPPSLPCSPLTLPNTFPRLVLEVLMLNYTARF